VLFDCERLGDAAVAVAAPDPGAPVYFLCPRAVWHLGRTEHVGRPEGCQDATVTEAELLAFIGRINRAIPRSIFRCAISVAVLRSLPVRVAGQTDLTAREVILDHGRHGGPVNLYSVTGIKFTTARKVAEKTVNEIFQRHRRRAVRYPPRPGFHGRRRGCSMELAVAQAPRDEVLA